MTCPRINPILRLVSNDLSATEELAIRQHLEACPTCEAAYVELQDTWDVMGAWGSHEVPQRDLEPSVAQLVNANERAMSPSVFRALWQSTPLRAAAVVALSVAAGIAAGRLTPVEVPGGGTPEAAAVDPSETVQALGLLDFGTSSATGLPLSLEGKASQTQEKSS